MTVSINKLLFDIVSSIESINSFLKIEYDFIFFTY